MTKEQFLKYNDVASLLNEGNIFIDDVDDLMIYGFQL
jgi:hypothetical protein